MKPVIRIETPNDYRKVENLTREAFWNVYRPGCTEHCVLHHYRSRPEFVPELSLVMELNGMIVAHIMYSTAEIVHDDGHTIPIMIFGPVSVLPGYQKQGYGAALITESLARAKLMDCGAVAITGNPNYYSRFGFQPAKRFGIFYADLPRNADAPFS